MALSFCLSSNILRINKSKFPHNFHFPSSTPMNIRHGKHAVQMSTRPQTLNRGSIETLLSEVLDIIFSTGISVGASRSFQVMQAVNRISREFISNPSIYLDESNKFSAPKALRRIFEELGATYIKLGQFIASSPTIFPAEYVLEFQSCLDKTPSIPFTDIRRVVQRELTTSRPVYDIFSYIDPVPLACASIAQVHKAILKSSGKEVVLKVRKPGVDATLKADLGFLYIAVKIAELINPELSRVSISNIVGDIRQSMLEELDFRKEAKNLINFREFLDRNAIVDATAPEPMLDLTSEQLLVMDYLKGVPLVDLEGIKKYTKNPELTLINALRTWAGSVVGNDVFHADVHGGNLLVLEDGRVGFIDFGIGKCPPFYSYSNFKFSANVCVCSWENI
jgi:aarF domain-containing kinase